MLIKNKNIVVTGGSGFIGSHFIDSIKKLGAKIINLDNLSYAANRGKKDKIDKNYKFIKVNINNKKKLNEIFDYFKPHIVINFAAETHVDRSIENPQVFLKTNVLGVGNLLEVSLKYWSKKRTKKDFIFLQVSTDEVYGSLNYLERAKKENDPFNPSSPYSSSKASADLIVKSWHKTYGLPCITVYPTNNFGPRQYPEKFIPLMIFKTLLKEKLTIYGTGKNVREWIYVKDCIEGIISLIVKGKIGESYNIGSGEQITNIHVARLILEKLSNKKINSLDHIKFVSDRPAHDLRYNVNSKKIQIHTNWKPKFTFEEAMSITINWYLKNQQWLKRHQSSYGILNRIGKRITY